MFQHDAINKEVADLRERMRLLQQDRRANIDLLQTSKVNHTNEIRSLKDENKNLRARLSNLQKSMAMDHDKDDGDVNNMKKLVLQKRNEFDAQKAIVLKLSTALNKLTDEARICQLEERRPNREDGPISRQLQLLENRLDKAMIQYNEAQGICSTYEHIVQRLKEERVSFENQFKALERTLQAKQRDFDELDMLSGDASHAREIVLQNLQKIKCTFEENKNNRARDVRNRQQHLRMRRQMMEKQERCETERRKTVKVTDHTQYVDVSMTNKIESTIPVLLVSKISQEQVEEQDNKLNVYENAFRKIKDATGVSNVNEVIRKFSGQESTIENLITLTKQNQIKIEELTKSQESLAHDVEKIKHNLSGSLRVTKTIDEQKEILSSRISRFERIKSQFDLLETVMVSIKTGVVYIHEKLLSLPEEFGVDRAIVTESTLPYVIRSSGEVLVDVHSKTRDKELKIDLECQDSRSIELTKLASRGWNLQVRRPMTSGAREDNNQRVTLPSAKVISVFDNDNDEEIGFVEIDTEEEISRDYVKRTSSNLIATEERRKLRSRKPEDE